MTTHDDGFPHVEWSRSANIYEVNVRQFTPEGTLAAFEAHLPRLQRMGVDILWFMPIQPIGVKNRKGTLGSNYSIKDYCSVNPEFGTLEDFRRVVGEAHNMGMRVIIDWVANHTAWDHTWVSEHPEWYKKDAKGEIHSYVYDNGTELEYWTDVVGLDYKQPVVWDAMIDALRFWVRETDIDGYRCDVAGLVPTPFWERARAELDAMKPVFMLAEWSEPELHKSAFDMTYGWDLYDVMSDIARGKADGTAIRTFLENPPKRFPRDAYRMLFTTNHDLNAWRAHDEELFGESFKAFAVLAATMPGMPLLYGGQEGGLRKRLAFFEKDPIEWDGYPLAEFYRELLAFKKANPALWNGQYGGPVELTVCTPAVVAFARARDDNRVSVAINVSAQAQAVLDPVTGGTLQLAPWGYSLHAESTAAASLTQ